MRRVFVVAAALVLLAAPGLSMSAVSGALPNTLTGTRQQAIQQVIERGLSQRGVPYSYGGGNVDGPSAGTGASTAPDPVPSAVPATGLGAIPIFGQDSTTAPTPAPAPKVVGFDSSGLVQYAFAGVGIKLPRSSGEQYKVGRKILPSQALPGDLIFFGPDGTQSVALFIGNGQMLEATPPAVVVSPVRTGSMAPYLSRIIEWQ